MIAVVIAVVMICGLWLWLKCGWLLWNFGEVPRVLMAHARLPQGEKDVKTANGEAWEMEMNQKDKLWTVRGSNRLTNDQGVALLPADPEPRWPALGEHCRRASLDSTVAQGGSRPGHANCTYVVLGRHGGGGCCRLASISQLQGTKEGTYAAREGACHERGHLCGAGRRLLKRHHGKPRLSSGPVSAGC